MRILNRIGRGAVLPVATIAVLVTVTACATVQPNGAGAPPRAQDIGGSVTGNVSTADGGIVCDGSTTTTVSLVGQTGIAGDPKTIMLVIDVSGSMHDAPSDPRFTNLKTAAESFVAMMDANTDGAADGTIGNGSSVGLVSFSDDATLVVAPTSDTATIDSGIEGLTALGYTNTASGLELAGEQSPDIVILFTDGEPNRPLPDAVGAATAQADALKAAGVEIFGIGITGTGGIDLSHLTQWASAPTADHVYTTTDTADLANLFDAVGAAITVPAATDVTVVDTVAPGFSVSGASADAGSVAVAGNTLTWTVPQLLTETVSLRYTITHDPAAAGGTLPVSSSIVYSDAGGASVSFPNATVEVHGCAAALDLSPASTTVPVGSSASLTATVSDDFGDPVQGVGVGFAVTPGTSVVDGSPGAPTPSTGSATTDASGQATFTFGDTVAATDTVTATAAAQPLVADPLEDSATVTWAPVTATLVLPGSHGAKSHGVIPVTVLGSADLDVSAIDASTVVFGSCSASPPSAHIAHKRGHPADVNGDSYEDIVFHFWFQETGLTSGDAEACLYGKTTAGLDFGGRGSLRIVP